jgi:hypothetical protein
MLNKQANRAGSRRVFALLAAVFIGVPCVAAPRCDPHIYFEGRPVDRVALWDVLVERCPAVDPNFERKLEALKRRWGATERPTTGICWRSTSAIWAVRLLPATCQCRSLNEVARELQYRV